MVLVSLGAGGMPPRKTRAVAFGPLDGLLRSRQNAWSWPQQDFIPVPNPSKPIPLYPAAWDTALPPSSEDEAGVEGDSDSGTSDSEQSGAEEQPERKRGRAVQWTPCGCGSLRRKLCV